MIEEKSKKTLLYLDFNPLLLKISLVLFKSPRGKKLKILVIVRQTPDTEAKIQTNSSGDGILTDDIKWILNPFDEFAVEEAVQIKEKTGAEVVVLTVGAERSVDAIRTSLAMGGDSGVHIKDDSFADMDPYALGKVIGSKIKSLGDIDLIIAGKKWIDEESNQVPIQVAEELGIPQATLASKVEVDESSKTAKVTSVIEGGEEIRELKLPAIITVEQGINEPRYASLPGIMKAKKKPCEEVGPGDINSDEIGISADALGVAGSRVKTDSIEIPTITRSLKVIEGNDVQQASSELAKLLREEAKII